jgi:hypothetical protein
MGVATMPAVAVVTAGDQAAAVVMTKAMTAAPHLQIPMVADHVHQTTWTTKFHSKINYRGTETKKGAEISALSFLIYINLLRGDCGAVCAAFHQFFCH